MLIVVILESLIKSLVTDIKVTNEPTNVSAYGNSDYVITKKDTPISHIDTKKVSKYLKSRIYKEQFTRYKKL